MYQGHRIGAVLLMSGEGLRFGSPIPKQFHLLDNKKVYRHALETFVQTEVFDEIILVCLDKWKELIQNEVGTLAHVVTGGKSRQESSYAGLKAFKFDPKIALIHDAVRPFVSQKIIRENIEQALIHGAVNTCIPSTDTLVFAPNHDTIKAIPNRADYMRGQTPQTFLYDWILEAHESAQNLGLSNATDDCRLILAAGKPVEIVHGSELNFKITSEFDLKIAETFLSLYRSRFNEVKL
jgi:2-C-methyl-D-erythritol 4-phosphate cytidylyltransferase